MKKLFAIMVLGLALASCKKSSSGGSSITATINDTSFSFNQQLTGTFINNGKVIFLTGNSSNNASTANQLLILIESNTAITPGIYSDTANYVDLPVIARGAEIEMTPYLTSLGPIDYNFSAMGLASNPFTVTVTSITPTSIQGTFSGTLYLDRDSTGLAGSTKVITNGRFNAPLTITNNAP